MTRFKDTDDLKDSLGSVGGAMGTWPFRTLWYVCRWERTGQTDPGVVAALQAENTAALAELEKHASGEFGMDVSTLRARRRALEAADTDEIREELSRAYRSEYDGSTTCPFEREGSDMACHRCPVAASALSHLSDESREPRVSEPE